MCRHKSVVTADTCVTTVPPGIIFFLAKLSFLNFHPLEVVSRCREPQLQADETYSHLLIVCPTVETGQKLM